MKPTFDVDDETYERILAAHDRQMSDEAERAEDDTKPLTVGQSRAILERLNWIESIVLGGGQIIPDSFRPIV